MTILQLNEGIESMVKNHGGKKLVFSTAETKGEIVSKINIMKIENAKVIVNSITGTRYHIELIPDKATIEDVSSMLPFIYPEELTSDIQALMDSGEIPLNAAVTFNKDIEYRGIGMAVISGVILVSLITEKEEVKG